MPHNATQAKCKWMKNKSSATEELKVQSSRTEKYGKYTCYKT